MLQAIVENVDSSDFAFWVFGFFSLLTLTRLSCLHHAATSSLQNEGNREEVLIVFQEDS